MPYYPSIPSFFLLSGNSFSLFHKNFFLLKGDPLCIAKIISENDEHNFYLEKHKVELSGGFRGNAHDLGVS